MDSAILSPEEDVTDEEVKKFADEIYEIYDHDFEKLIRSEETLSDLFDLLEKEDFITAKKIVELWLNNRSG